MPKILYQNGSTHEWSIMDAKEDVREFANGRTKYREGITGYVQTGDAIKLRVDWRTVVEQIGWSGYVFTDDSVLAGRCGAVRVLTDDEFETIKNINDAEIAKRREQIAASTKSTATMRCTECGHPGSGRGKCRHCGSDDMWFYQ